MVKERSKQLDRRTEKTISYDGALCCLKVNEPLLAFVERRRLQLDTPITTNKDIGNSDPVRIFLWLTYVAISFFKEGIAWIDIC